MRNATLFLTLLLVFGTEATLQAQTVNLNPTQDNTLYENIEGATSNGSGDYIFAGNALGPTIRRALLQFDIAGSIPAGATVTDVLLTLNMSRTIAGPTDVTLHRVTAAWGESTSDAGGQEGGGTPAAAGDATWLHTGFNTTFWATAGGDFIAAPSATTSVAGNGAYAWGSTAGLVADVQSWLDTPAQNFGWILIGDETATPSAKRFDSRDNAAANVAPVLRIQYSPLPVELVAFNALVDAGTVRLDWETASETNNAGFEVQHTPVRTTGLTHQQADTETPSGDWQTLAFVKGYGTTATPRSYSYTVAGLTPGRYLFRLKQIDFDGSFELSDPLETTLDVPGTHVLSAAYPNPFNPSTTFTLVVAQTQPVQVTLHDALGREVRTLFAGELAGALHHRFTLNGTNLPSGLYLYRVSSPTFTDSRQVLLLK